VNEFGMKLNGWEKRLDECCSDFQLELMKEWEAE
jgi:hypothetical protein